MKTLPPNPPLTFFKMQDEHFQTKCLKDVFSPQSALGVDLLDSLKHCSRAQEQKNMLKKAFAGAWCLLSAFLGHGQGLYRCMPDGHGYNACVDKHNISKSFLVFLGQPSRECLRFLPCPSLNSGKFKTSLQKPGEDEGIAAGTGCCSAGVWGFSPFCQIAGVGETELCEKV